MLKTIIVAAVFLLLTVLVALKLKKGGANQRTVWSVALFLASLCAAYVLKSGVESPYVSEYVPFYKVINLVEFGYASVLTDLLYYAAPFVLAGFFLLPAFPGLNLLWAFVVGIVASLAFAAVRLIGGGSFVTDEFLFAGLGSATGFGLYCFLIDLIRKKPFVEKNDVVVPGKYKSMAGMLFAIAAYLFIALVMVFDYGETYAPIQFFESDVPLPAMETSFELDAGEGEAHVYAPSTQPVFERATAVSLALNINGGVSNVDGICVAEDENAKLSYTESGSFTYELKSAPMGDEPSEEQAVEAVKKLFSERTLLTVSLGQVTDIVKKNDESGAFLRYDIYFTTAIGECPIVGSNTLVVSVGRGSAVTMIRKYDGDLTVEANVRTISQKQAYERLLAGEGAYTLFSSAATAKVTDCKLAYMANSSQGYYLPIWLFTCEAAGADGNTVVFEGYVEAKK